MSQCLPFDEIKFVKDILNTPDDSDIGHFLEVDLKYPDEIWKNTKNFPEDKFAPEDKFSEYMKEMKQDIYTKCKKVICDWTDKKKYSIH